LMKVSEHINKFPSYESHYTLAITFNHKKMFNMNKAETENYVSILYREEFHRLRKLIRTMIEQKKRKLLVKLTTRTIGFL
jgi:hypothetical protein